MRRATRIAVGVVAIILLSLGGVASAETLSWDAPTKFTDGTNIGSATITYQAYWSTNQNLTGLNPLGSASTSTSRAFDIDAAGLPRGTTIYFTVKATVGGEDSAYASPFQWLVPVPVKIPSAPTNLRMN